MPKTIKKAQLLSKYSELSGVQQTVF